ncbi:MAG: VRR-NUC domain-containing protein [Deferribacterales bacterium]
MKIIASEHNEQVSLFQWAAMQTARYPELALMFAVPNGGLRNATVAAKLKAEGVKPGVPDIFLPVVRGGYHGLFIEMKRTKGGKLSAEQANWIAKLLEQRYAVYKCEGWAKAKECIEQYLKLAPESGRKAVFP